MSTTDLRKIEFEKNNGRDLKFILIGRHNGAEECNKSVNINVVDCVLFFLPKNRIHMCKKTYHVS